ncbi:hypothetical protein BDR26DRAFT_455893 [Obelidium mucronatum]|nr:hypothetical protein BDR26DRAFT_455893 [Obelidium mucronatum]
MPPSPEPVIRTEERVFKNEDGDTVTQTITTSTETVTTLKPVEVVEEVVADVVGPETVTEEGDLDMAWLAKQIADNEKIAGLELPDGLTTQEIVLIAKAIKTNSVLDKLDLQGNEINDTGLLAIAEGLAVNRGIEEFRIGNQTVVASDETERILAEAVFKNSNLLVFTYGFRNIKYQKLVEEALARNNTAHIASRTQKITKTVFVEEVKEITKVLATETEIEDEDDACVSGPTSNKDLAIAASSAAAPAVAVAVAAVAAAVPACVDDSSKDVSATPVVVNEIAIGEAPIDEKVSATITTTTTTTTDQLIDPAIGRVIAETVSKNQEQDYVVVEEKVEGVPVPAAPSSDGDLSYVQVSDDDTPSTSNYTSPPVKQESSAVPSNGEGISIFGYLGKAAAGVGKGLSGAANAVANAATAPSSSEKESASLGYNQPLYDNPPASTYGQTPADEKTAAYDQTPSYTAPVDPVADAKNRRKMILLRLEALKSDDYDTYEEFVAAQQALSLELVELEKYEAPSDDAAPAVAEKSSTAPSNGEGINIFGYLGKAAANVGKGLSDTANAVAKAATAPSSTEKEPTRVSSGFVNYQFYYDNQPVPSVDEIPTTAKIVAYDEKASYPVSDDPIADAITRRKMIVFRLETLKPDDYETYEEYVAAQQALSLELVELEKYQAPSSDAAPAC